MIDTYDNYVPTYKHYTITIELKTDSIIPDEWIAESINQQLEDGEELISITKQLNYIEE